MDNEKYLLKLQDEYLFNSRAYMDAIRDGKSLKELQERALELRCLLTEIRALKEEMGRARKKS